MIRYALLLALLPLNPPPAPPIPEPAPKAAPDKPKLVLTADTEILLDGRPCKLADVPDDATIEDLRLKIDLKTVVWIHFRSKAK